ncbi:MAG: hypothetical protein PHS93_10240 [Candidatus Omnitrophica bacterium]|jgi:hypothetical protein|nr:hypothetical protein [Candidatus Omnitrophota bacterium]MDD5353529.1 hypothetical protein [Candidatus Omnitrophota bacterium]
MKNTKQKKAKYIRYGVRSEGVVLIGHSGLPLMESTRKEAKRTWHKKGDKIIRILIEEL